MSATAPATTRERGPSGGAEAFSFTFEHVGRQRAFPCPAAVPCLEPRPDHPCSDEPAERDEGDRNGDHEPPVADRVHRPARIYQRGAGLGDAEDQHVVLPGKQVAREPGAAADEGEHDAEHGIAPGVGEDHAGERDVHQVAGVHRVDREHAEQQHRRREQPVGNAAHGLAHQPLRAGPSARRRRRRA